MAKIPTMHIDGDAAVGRHVAVGGNATVQGSMRVGHNVRIDGWLEARNIKGPNKGLFKTDAKLKERYPTPQDGWWALVGDTVPAQVYIASGGSWHAQENEDGSPKMSGAPDVEPTELLEAVHTALDEMDELKLDVKANSENIDGLGKTQKEHGESIKKLGADVQTAQGTADKAQPRWVDFDALDYMGTDLTGLIEATYKTEHTRWRVTTPLGDDRLTIGVLELLSTPGQCAVTQVLMTNCLIDDKGVLSKGHTDAEIRVLYRTFSVMSGSMGDDARLKWTPWKPLEPESLANIRVDLKGLSEDLDRVANTLQDVDQSLDATNADVEALQDTVGGHGSSLSELEQEVPAVEGRVKAIEDSVGVAGGIAPLGSNGLIPAQYIPGAMDDVKYFDGVMTSAVVQIGSSATDLSSTSPGCSVVATSDLTSFMLRHTWTEDGTERMAYFSQWADSSLWVQPIYQVDGKVSMVPLRDKVYIDTEAAQCYLWGGSKLVSTDKQLALGHTERTAFPGSEGAALARELNNNTRRVSALELNVPEELTDAEVDALVADQPATIDTNETQTA